MKYFVSLLTSLTICFSVSAQSADTTSTGGNASKKNTSSTESYNDDYSKWSIGIHVGSNFMIGDLSSYNGFVSHDANLHINGGMEGAGSGTLTRMTNSWWGFRGQLHYGRLSGLRVDDNNTEQAFRSRMYAGQLGLVLNPFHAFRISNKKPSRLNGLVMLDLGGAFLNDYAYIDRMGSPSLLNLDDGFFTPFIAFTGEFKYELFDYLSIDAGAQARMFFTDRVDARMSGEGNDLGLFTYIGLTYNFGRKGKQKSLIFTSPLSDMWSIVKDVESKMDQLTTDSDGDGVPDYFDKDPETPEGVAVDGAGRPLDVDMDGIPDYMDADPFTNKGAKVDKDGRELDSDGDGVPDSRDLEPNTPKGALVDVRGREIKLSGGGDVSDAFIPQVYFGFNSATVTAANRDRMATIARIMKSNENINITLIGHTDKVGSEEYNKRLGERRAQAVKDFLVKNFDIEASRINVDSKGKGSPLGKFNDINRRVEVRVN
ncbi:MAG: OmpA family protein [Cryomorphaceae bacterium]|nr:OmpA family protein [Cryomorphaceae bacterium]